APLAINSTDNCSVWTYSPVAKAYNSSNLGVNNLTITVKDFSNNASTCVSQVTVLPYNSNNLVAPDNDQTKYADPVENMAGGEELAFKVFPNPTEGQSTVLFELPQDQLYYLRLFDINGRLILDFDVPGFKGDNSIVLDLSVLESGVYIIDILSYDLHGRQKLIIQR
ncbi:MAG: T9SS type A sorting domain-containing protein, partial [Saprospiraceae bacterium]|nr:T9SS type A sorting domain-containing protein [Saprospiraceae bacterium]